MEEETSLIVTRIKNGTVIDHIDGGKGLHVLEALEIDGKEGDVITIALNVPSGKLKKKDIIKLENEIDKLKDEIKRLEKLLKDPLSDFR